MPDEVDARPMWKALVEVQKTIPTLIKNAKGQVGTRVYKYLSLDELMEQILPVLHENDFVLMQPVNIDEAGRTVLDTILVHTKTGVNITSRMPLNPVKDDPQSVGSAITYARRYSLMPLLGLVADDDDDGSEASRPAAPKMAQPPDKTKDETRPADPPITVDRAKAISAAADAKHLIRHDENDRIMVDANGRPEYEPIFKALLRSVGKVQRNFISELTGDEAEAVERWIAARE